MEGHQDGPRPGQFGRDGAVAGDDVTVGVGAQGLPRSAGDLGLQPGQQGWVVSGRGVGAASADLTQPPHQRRELRILDDLHRATHRPGPPSFGSGEKARGRAVLDPIEVVVGQPSCMDGHRRPQAQAAARRAGTGQEPRALAHHALGLQGLTLGIGHPSPQQDGVQLRTETTGSRLDAADQPRRQDGVAVDQGLLDPHSQGQLAECVTGRRDGKCAAGGVAAADHIDEVDDQAGFHLPAATVLHGRAERGGSRMASGRGQVTTHEFTLGEVDENVPAVDGRATASQRGQGGRESGLRLVDEPASARTWARSIATLESSGLPSTWAARRPTRARGRSPSR